MRLDSRVILLFLVASAGMARADEPRSSPSPINVGTTAVESSIRRPPTELVEGSDRLNQTAGKLIRKEYEKIEAAELSPGGGSR